MQTSNKTVISTAIVTAALLTTGCSSSSSKSEPITQAGFVTLEEYDGGSFQDIYLDAVFMSFPGDISPYASSNTAVTADTCTLESDVEDDEQLVALFNGRQFLSAGDALVVSSPLGTYTTLVENVSGDQIYYDTADMLENLPANLTIDIPGNEFPAFSNMPFPNAVAVNDFNYSADALTEISEYSWTPTGADNTSIYIDISYVDADSETQIIACELVDDGSFKLPDDIVAKVGSFTAGRVIYASVDTEIAVQSGNTLLSVLRAKTIPLL